MGSRLLPSGRVCPNHIGEARTWSFLRLLRRFEGCSWLLTYVAAVRKLLCRYDVYSLFHCFPYIRDAGYGEEFKDVGDGKTSLSRGIFEWLVSIWPSHLVYRSGDTCYLEPYVLSQFVRQFGYDQLWVCLDLRNWCEVRK